MSLNYFKDKVFELLDEDQTLEIVEIETNDRCVRKLDDLVAYIKRAKEM